MHPPLPVTGADIGVRTFSYQGIEFTVNAYTSNPKYIECWGMLRIGVMIRDHCMCRNCGSRDDLQVAHRDQDKSNNSNGNLVTLCGTCHRSFDQKLIQGAKLPSEWKERGRKGWATRRAKYGEKGHT